MLTQVARSGSGEYQRARPSHISVLATNLVQPPARMLSPVIISKTGSLSATNPPLPL